MFEDITKLVFHVCYTNTENPLHLSSHMEVICISLKKDKNSEL